MEDKPTQPVFVVDREGRVIDASPDLREHIGRRCSDVVRIRPTTGPSPCSRTCTGTLIDAGTSISTVGRTAACGDARVVCTALAESALVTLLEAPPQVPGSSLTPREREVLGLIAEGLTTRLIGRRLGISYATARTHVEHVRDKLGARSRAEAVDRARRLGWYP